MSIILRFPDFITAIEASEYLDDSGIDFHWSKGIGGLPNLTEEMYEAVIEDDGIVTTFIIPSHLRQYIIEVKLEEEISSSDDIIRQMRSAIQDLLIALDVAIKLAGEQEVSLGVGLTLIGAKDRGRKAMKLGIDSTKRIFPFERD